MRAAGVLLALALAGSPALALSPLERGFRAADRDGDGVITADELEAQQANHFRTVDRNADGLLTLEEFTGAYPPGLTDVGRLQWIDSRRLQFAGLDGDRDGRLTREEFAETARRAFLAADIDRDSALSAAELARFIESASAHMAQNAARQRRNALDRDGDGRLTMQEFAAARAAAHAERDDNRDGALDFSEYAPSIDRLPPDAQASLRATFATADEDGDGRIDALENHRASSGAFRQLDRDADGDLSLQELHNR